MGYMDLALSYSNKMRVVEAPASGGGLSQNGKFSYGYASSAGKRSSMEDFFETRIDGIDGEIVGLFGVFDGHGGARAAEYVKRHLFSNLITHPKFISDTKSAIADAYNHTDSELLKSENSHTRDAGSTASTAILVGDRLLVANVGDSRAVICRGGNAFAVSRDHKPDQSDERERIENAGGFVMWAGTWRVGGVLAVSRAFGDRLLKQYVVADPEIQEEKIDDSLEFLILASDGLWDVFSNEEAVAVVKEVEEPEESTKKLVGEAIKRGSADNITCVVVRFLESKTANKKDSDISSTHASSSQEANPGQTAVRSDSDHKISANETNQNRTAVRNDSDHKISAKETNQDHTAKHNELYRNAENESLNQKPIAARSSDNSGRNSSNQKPVAITAPGRSVSSEKNGSAEEKNQMPIHSGLESKSSAKQPGQGHVSVHNNLDRSVANQKPVAADKKAIAATHTTSSEQSGPIGGKNQILSPIHSGSESKSSAKQPGQGHITVNNNLDQSVANQKPDAAGKKTTAATHTTSSEQRGSIGEKNQILREIHSGSESKSSAKQPGQEGHITVHNNLDRSIANQKPVAAGNKAIAATHTTSSEHNGPIGQKNQFPSAFHSGSESKSSAKQPAQGHVHNNLDRRLANQKPVADGKKAIAATHTTSSEQSGSIGEKNQKPTAVHSDSAASKASSVNSNTNLKYQY